MRAGLSPKWLLGGLVLIALGLRLATVDKLGFDQDELATIHFAQQPIWRIIFGPGFDNHPPLYYAFIHVWLSATGVNEIALRLPSVLAGTLAVWLAFKVGRTLLNPAAGWAGAVGLALLRPHILWSQHGRMYEFLTVFALLSIWSMAIVMTRPDAGRLMRYVIVTELMIYTQSAGVFVVVAQNLFWAGATICGLLPRKWSNVFRWIGVQGLIVLLYVPWTIVAATRLAAIQNGFWVKPEGVVSYMGGLLFFFAGTKLYPGAFLIAPAMTILMAFAVWRTIRHRDGPSSRGVGLAAAVAVIPGLAMAVLSQFTQPIFVPRALLPSAVACYWLAGYAIAFLSLRLRIAVASIALLAAVVSAAQFELVPPPRGDLRDALTGLCYDVHSDDMVYLHGWPEAKDYMTRLCVRPGDPNATPRVVTSRFGELAASVAGWCRDPAHHAVYVMHVSNSETPAYGLITVDEYIAVLTRARLELTRSNDQTVGHTNLWHCQR